jgi:hypothetical protein
MLFLRWPVAGALSWQKVSFGPPHACLRDVLARLPSLNNRQIKDIVPAAWAKAYDCHAPSRGKTRRDIRVERCAPRLNPSIAPRHVTIC